MSNQNPKNPKNEIYQLVKDSRNHHKVIGVVLAANNGDKNNPVVSIGWSYLHNKDRFDKAIGITMARGRAKVGTDAAIPQALEVPLQIMKDRAKKYFKLKENDFVVVAGS